MSWFVIIHFKDITKWIYPCTQTVCNKMLSYNCHWLGQSCEWDVEHSSDKAKHLLPQPGHLWVEPEFFTIHMDIESQHKVSGDWSVVAISISAGKCSKSLCGDQFGKVIFCHFLDHIFFSIYFNRFGLLFKVKS